MSMRTVSHAFALAKSADRIEIDVYDIVGMPGTESSAAMVRQALRGAPDAKQIDVRLNTIGGIAADGLAIYRDLADHPAHVRATITGQVASAGTIIAMAGDEIRMAANADFLIHDPSRCVCGDAAFLHKMAEDLDRMGASMAELYAARTGGDPAQIRDQMREETTLSAEEALEAGFITEILPAKSGKAAACLEPALALFTKVPDRIRERALPEDQWAPPTPPAAPLQPGDWGSVLLAGQRLPNHPAPTPAPSTPPTPEGEPSHNQEKNMRTIAKALGLTEDATEAQIVQVINERSAASQAANTHTQTLLTALAATTVDQALGVIEAAKTAQAELIAAQKQLADQARQAEDSERAEMISKLEREKRLSPAQRDGFAKTCSLETLREFAKTAPVISATSQHTQPGHDGTPGSAGRGGQATELRWNGKAWGELKGDERAALYHEDRGLYDQMRPRPHR